MGVAMAALNQDCGGDLDLHKALVAALSRADRKAARLAARATGLYGDLFEKERHPHSDESDGEPQVAP